MSDASSPSISDFESESDLISLLIQPGTPTLVEPETPQLTGFPAPLTSFVGRAQEIETLTQLLQRPAVREVTLTGPGGIGKTRLALQVAEQLAPDFVDGVLFVPLSTVQSAEDVPLTILRVMGHPD